MTTKILESPAVQALAQIVEESTRSTREGVKYFIEPALNTLARAKSKRHHIIFGRRGSGKSSLLAKVSADLTALRIPNAYVDLEKFKGHSYRDVLISVLIETLKEFKKWLDGAAVEPRSRTSFWTKMISIVPVKKGLDRDKTADISKKLERQIQELSDVLFTGDESKRQVVRKEERSASGSAALKADVVGVSASG